MPKDVKSDFSWSQLLVGACLNISLVRAIFNGKKNRWPYKRDLFLPYVEEASTRIIIWIEK